MTTTLTLDTDEARRALARCTRLLLKWADEESDTPELPLAGESGVSGIGGEARRQSHFTTNRAGGQIEGVRDV